MNNYALTIRNNLSKGTYTCINFNISDEKERNKYNIFFNKHQDIIRHRDIIKRCSNSTCFTIFTTAHYFDTFVVYDSGKGEHMIDGTFKRNNPDYIVSPIMTYDEFMLYVGKYMGISFFMYKPRKITREI